MELSGYLKKEPISFEEESIYLLAFQFPIPNIETTFLYLLRNVKKDQIHGSMKIGQGRATL